LSILLDLDEEIAAAAGSGKLAVRVPAHAGLRRMLRDLGMGLTATSANLSGAPAITDPAQLDRLLAGTDAVIVEDGRLQGGPPSTLLRIDGTSATILRPGRLAPDTLRRAAPKLDFRESFSAGAVEMSVEESR
jgi:L-threonylcarbamoyladenylate synthase